MYAFNNLPTGFNIYYLALYPLLGPFLTVTKSGSVSTWLNLTLVGRTLRIFKMRDILTEIKKSYEFVSEFIDFGEPGGKTSFHNK